jgi:hypothetical protein
MRCFGSDGMSTSEAWGQHQASSRWRTLTEAMGHQRDGSCGPVEHHFFDGELVRWSTVVAKMSYNIKESRET